MRFPSPTFCSLLRAGDGLIGLVRGVAARVQDDGTHGVIGGDRAFTVNNHTIRITGIADSQPMVP